jgi:hypothetical protein
MSEEEALLIIMGKDEKSESESPKPGPRNKPAEEPLVEEVKEEEYDPEKLQSLIAQIEGKKVTRIRPCHQIVDAQSQQNYHKNGNCSVERDDSAQGARTVGNGAIDGQCDQEEKCDQIKKLSGLKDNLIKHTCTGVSQNDLTQGEDQERVDERHDHREQKGKAHQLGSCSYA